MISPTPDQIEQFFERYISEINSPEQRFKLQWYGGMATQVSDHQPFIVYLRIDQHEVEYQEHDTILRMIESWMRDGGGMKMDIGRFQGVFPVRIDRHFSPQHFGVIATIEFSVDQINGYVMEPEEPPQSHLRVKKMKEKKVEKKIENHFEDDLFNI